MEDHLKNAQELLELLVEQRRKLIANIIEVRIVRETANESLIELQKTIAAVEGAIVDERRRMTAP
ncbi:hypothetical protein QNA08_13225 [Chelatococcus sp. SYSU_G07232]|uniref:Histidine kinase n=1 Tax=Chelatococcus albus TaxID=3047466 RepID=A0ABT7AIK1_9HYPH|nr:hypothetical protein [Chelatococcus sp. SYSU_G07232]MDJ1159199.1 hypothetical protein [Chelatococcus sp. SYSU_G07232]